ncbi:MAG: hypothetical protein ACRCTI_07465 [Beijerinckiaceae bacterium]
MPEPLQSLTIGNPENWGKLVKSWSTGRNYFDPKQPAPQPPRTVRELKQQLKQFNCDGELASWVKGIAILQSSQETLAIRIPPKDLVERTESMLRKANGGKEPARDVPALDRGAYPLPDFYAQFLRIRPDQRTLEVLLNFHASRVGDYSVCACQ